MVCGDGEVLRLQPGQNGRLMRVFVDLDGRSFTDTAETAETAQQGDQRLKPTDPGRTLPGGGNPGLGTSSCSTNLFAQDIYCEVLNKLLKRTCRICPDGSCTRTSSVPLLNLLVNLPPNLPNLVN